MFFRLFRNITPAGSFIACSICIGLSVVYNKLDELEKEKKTQELDFYERKFSSFKNEK